MTEMTFAKMSHDNDPIDAFERKRRMQEGDTPSLEPMDASGIDDMLDALDRVLSAEETQVNVDAMEPAPIVETVVAILHDLQDNCKRLAVAAAREGDVLSQEFLTVIQPRLQFLIKRAEDMPLPAAGAIEVELDYEALHAFMLDPDIDRLAS